MQSNPLHPGDWPEDFGNENGNYLNRCIICKDQFAGHKLRIVCRVCEQNSETKAKLRAEWLHKYGAPEDWIIMTDQEVGTIKAALLQNATQLGEERDLRQRLAESLTEILAWSKIKTSVWALRAAELLEESRERDQKT
jgi:hypothetical protein